MATSADSQHDKDTKFTVYDENRDIEQSSTASTESPTHYLVYHVYYQGMPCNHQGIFLETHEKGTDSGHLYHVIGRVLQGMTYHHRTEVRPEDSPEFVQKQDLGYIKKAEYRSFQQVCEGIEIPGK